MANKSSSAPSSAPPVAPKDIAVPQIPAQKKIEEIQVEAGTQMAELDLQQKIELARPLKEKLNLKMQDLYRLVQIFENKNGDDAYKAKFAIFKRGMLADAVQNLDS